MPTQKLVQNNFTSGQYDRTAQGKEGSALVANGFAKGLNVLSGDSGQLFKRLGTKYLSKISEQSVLVPFRLPDGNDIILLCTDKKIKAYEYNNGKLNEFLIPDDNAPIFPTTGWTSATNGDYTVSVEAAVQGTNQGAGFNAVSGRPLKYYGKGTYIDAGRTTTNATTYISIESQDAQLLQSLNVRWCLTCSGNHTGHYKGWLNPILQYSDDGVQWTSVQTKVKNPYSVGDTDAYRGSYHYGSGGDEKTENYVVSEIINVSHKEKHKYWRVYFLDKINNKSVFGSERLDLFVSSVMYASNTYEIAEFDTQFTSDVLKKIKYDQDDTMMIICAAGVKPIQIKYQSGKLTKTDFNAVDAWGEPSCCCFFQNRLWFGGFTALPTSVLASKFGVYDNFTVQTTVQYDDYLNLKCNQLKSPIVNIVGGDKVLYCTSEDGISFVDGGSGGMVATNQNIEFVLRNKMPAGDSTPTVKDDVLLYASSNGLNLYSVDFDLLVNRFQVTDLAKYAKDVVNAKIDELHYVNDGGKLVYGLLENRYMFALLYEKNTLQGFFPINIHGAVYDICSIKNGRNYKLLMVVNRSGNWLIEEFINTQNFVDTSAPLLTKEDKKWATYDNLENNIALDSSRTYDERKEYSGTFTDTSINTTYDFSSLVGKSVMLAQLNDDKAWAIVKILSKTDESVNIEIETRRGNSDYFDVVYPEFTQFRSELTTDGKIGIIAQGKYIEPQRFNVLYEWAEVESGDTLYTDSKNPKIGDFMYESNGELSDWVINAINTNSITVRLDIGPESSPARVLKSTGHKILNPDIQIEYPVYKVIYGVVYDAYAYIKIEKPYESMKTIRQINLAVIDTAHLEVGTCADDMQELENIDDSSYYDLTNITLNGTFRVVPSDTPEWEKNIILRSNKGLPFTVNAVEVFVNYSNMGGN